MELGDRVMILGFFYHGEVSVVKAYRNRYISRYSSFWFAGTHSASCSGSYGIPDPYAWNITHSIQEGHSGDSEDGGVDLSL